jgi:PIN domain
MFKILVDTCVWLDLAKDYQGQPVLEVLEELVRQKQVSIILPQNVLDEFTRNKARVAEESGRSLSGALKRAKEAVDRLGNSRKKRFVLGTIE